MGNLYVARVGIRAVSGTYRPGQVVDLPPEELGYLIAHDFVRPVAETPKEPAIPEDGIASGFGRLPDAVPEDGAGDGLWDGPEDGDHVPQFLGEEELNTLPNKGAIVEYAESIGLDGLSADDHRTELIDKVLAYIGEVEEK